MKIGKILIGVLSGLTFGMLFAPRAGKDLRKEMLKKSGTSGADALKVLGDALIDAGSEAYAEFLKLSEHEQVKALTTLSQEKLSQFIETAEDHGYELAGKVQEKLEQVSDAIVSKAKQMEKGAKKAMKNPPRGRKTTKKTDQK